jgi:hypothetical protein
MNDKPNHPAQPTPQVGGDRTTYTFSPVTVTETVGATFLGLMSILLTFALLRALAHIRRLERKLAES